MIAIPDFLDQSDKIGYVWSLFDDTFGDASAPGVADVAESMEDLADLISALDDDEYELDIQSFVAGEGGVRKACARARYLADRQTIAKGIFVGFLSVLEAYFNRFGTSGTNASISEYIDTANGGLTPDFTDLVCPEFAEVYYMAKGGDLLDFDSGYWPTPTSIFSPVIADMGNYNIATTTFTAGDDVDTDQYAEIEPEGHVSTTVNGTCAVTVTGTNHAGTTARTWTGDAGSVAAPNTFVLTPTVGGDRLRSIQNIEVVGDAAAGIFHVQSILERAIA